MLKAKNMLNWNGPIAINMLWSYAKVISDLQVFRHQIGFMMTNCHFLLFLTAETSRISHPKFSELAIANAVHIFNLNT